MRKLQVAAMVVCALAPWCAQISESAVLDEHFGVSLSLTYSPNAAGNLRFNRPSFTPSTIGSIDYVVNDWWNGNNTQTASDENPTGGFGGGNNVSGGEAYDVEAIYIDDDPNNIYIAIVTSFDDPWGVSNGSSFYVSGDIAIDVGLNPNHSGTDAFGYDYGININYETQQGPGQDATVSGTPPTFPNYHSMYRTSNNDWYLGNPNSAIQASGEYTNIDPNNVNFSGILAGSVFVDYRLYTFPGNQKENGYDTYIIEAVIPRIFFGGLNEGDPIGISWSPGCRNDGGVLHLFGDIDTPFEPPLAIPEPMSIISLITACLGLGGRYLSRKKN